MFNSCRLLHWLANMVAVTLAGRTVAPVESHKDSRRTQLARLSDKANGQSTGVTAGRARNLEAGDVTRAGG